MSPWVIAMRLSSVTLNWVDLRRSVSVRNIMLALPHKVSLKIKIKIRKSHKKDTMQKYSLYHNMTNNYPDRYSPEHDKQISENSNVN